LGLLLMPAGARAATAPAITTEPAISGPPQVGKELVATAAWTGDPRPSAAWAWKRCPRPVGGCTPIAGATGERYRIVEADIGSFLRVELEVTNSAGSAQARSKPTAAIAPAPAPTPTPTPTPTPAPPAPTATPEAVPTAAPTASPTATPGTAIPVVEPVTVAGRVVAASPLVLDPFPVVRVKGFLTATGARVTLLTVRAPRGVRIAVDCTGRGCPTRHYELAAGKRRLRKFERDLKAGTRLEIRVTKPGYVGKFTAIEIRRDAAPRRTDRCLKPSATRPVKCSAG
jgi:hypothetical protein